jgi:predicted dehydrogenase
MSSNITRREAIGMTVAGASSILAARGRARGPSSGGAASSKSGKLGFAVVGIGKLAQDEIIPALRKTDNAYLAALVSGHPEKARRVAAENGVSNDAIYNYENYDQIAKNPDIDVVYIVLPNNMHAEYTIRALKAGKHVLCEKPMASTVADAEAMVAAAKAAKRHLMIAYRCLTEPLNVEAMRRVRSGSLGKTRLVITKMVRQSTLSDPSDAWRLDMKMSGGGALADMGIYGINGTRYLLNEEPVEVRATSQTDKSDPRFKSVEDLYSWEFRFPSGAIAQGSTSFDASDTMAYEVYGEQKRIVADPGCFYGGNHLSLVQGGNRTEIPIREVDHFAREMDWMADVVLGKKPMLAPGEEGLQDMRLIAAIMESAEKNGAPVKTDFGYRRAVDPVEAIPA